MSNHKFNDYWAVTMFSFTNELLAAKQTPLELIEQALSLTKNIEIDGPQHFRNYPHPNDKEISDLLELLSRHGARISLLGGAIDRARSATRMVGQPEIIASVKDQLRLAKRIGAYGVRLMVGGLSLEELQEVAPLAEELDIQILFELHGVMTADSALAKDCLALVKAVDSPNVGLMFDSSLFMEEIPQVFKNAMTKIGVSNVDEIASRWASTTLEDFKQWLMPQLPQLPPPFKAFLPTLTSRMGHTSPNTYDEYLPYIRCVHLKYWEIADRNGDDELLKYLYQHNYAGFLTSEWGGHEWESVTTPAFDTTREHKKLVERSFNLAH